MFTIKEFLIRFTILSVIICENAHGAAKDYYSSVTGLENLLNTEAVLLTKLQDYLDAMEDHIAGLQNELASIREEHLTASKDLEDYLNNPVNAYRLIKRLQTDWAALEEIVHSSGDSDASRSNFLDVMEMFREKQSFPTVEDVDGAAIALVRLQETYKLDVMELASGILNGVKYGSSMTWQDCFMVGRHLYENRDFNHTIPWLKQSVRMLMNEEYRNDPITLDFIESVAAYHQEMGDFETALKLVNYVIAIDANRENMQDNKIYLAQMISDGIKQGHIHDTIIAAGSYHQTDEYKQYEKVCRGEHTRTPTEERPLRCKFHTNNVPYRLLQPFKIEEHHLDPYIVEFHDVIGDRQINAVKDVSKSRMLRSEVCTKDGVTLSASSFRTSKSAWFQYHKNQYMTEMLNHLQHLTGLNVEDAEELQVANYGIGGHYEPHWDFFEEDVAIDNPELRNRLATGIYYLSDVEEGGGTAFIFLRILIKPKKGNLLFWYNLHSSEDPDYRTKHAACPVLKGSKWIANIWLRARNQDHARPCGLKRGKGTSLMYKDSK